MHPPSAATLHRTFDFPTVADHLARLTTRLRWKRWLTRLSRLIWLAGAVFVLLYLSDLAWGLDTLALRISSATLLGCVSVLTIFDFARSWWTRIDPLGVAQLLERCHPELAERVVTLVQIQRDPALVPDPEVAYLVGLEAERQVAEIAPASACPLGRPVRNLTAAVGFFAVVFSTLGLAATFDSFAGRFADAWNTSLIPFDLQLHYAQEFGGPRLTIDGKPPVEMTMLGDHVYGINVFVRMLNRRAKEPTECWLVCQDAAGRQTKIAMRPNSNGFSAHLRNRAELLRCWAQSGDIVSGSFIVFPIMEPRFKDATRVEITTPQYFGPAAPVSHTLESVGGTAIDVPRWSRMKFTFSLDAPVLGAWLRIQREANSEHEKPEQTTRPLDVDIEKSASSVEMVADRPGRYEAEMIVQIGGGLAAILPVGRWTVHDDQPPRFTQPLRVHGADAELRHDKELRMAPGEALKLHTAIEDDHGLDAVAVEYRINDGPVQSAPWLHARGKKSLTVNDWLPIPAGLKEGDRLQWRLRATDNRRLKKGEIACDNGVLMPTNDLSPQAATLPASVGAEARWFTFQIGKPGNSLVKDQVEAQADEVREVVARLKEKLRAEAMQLEKLQRDIHLQFALTATQRAQTEKIRKLNRDITGDLLRAGERFAANAALARLADRFFDIAETEMLKSAEALNRFSDKERPVMEGEKDLQAAHDAVKQALKKLEGMDDLNKLLAQDRFDQWQIEKLAHRQDELAQKLAGVLKEPLSDAELAQQIEAIRQEQDRLAAERAELERENPLVKESLEAQKQQQDALRLAQTAEELVGKMKQGPDGEPKLPMGKAAKDAADKAEKLADKLMELAQKGGPEAKGMAKEAAQAIERSKKSMDAAEAMKAKGDAEAAKKAEEDAGKQLELAVKKLAKLAQDQAMKGQGKDGAEKTAEAIQESGKLMKKAQDKVRTMPKDAQIAMKGAAQKLAQAALQSHKQAAKHLPNLARNPTARAGLPMGGAGTRLLPKDAALEAFQGKAWGELPGELKTRMLQDVRTRFGEEYADLIQHYFERLAESRKD